MTWNTLANLATGNLVTETHMDNIRENIEWLKTPPSDQDDIVANASNITTTSTSFVNITGFSSSITTTGGAVICSFIGHVEVSANEVYFDVAVNGTREGGTDGFFRVISSQQGPFSYTIRITGLSAGSYTFTPQWKVRSGTATLYVHTTSNRSFAAQFWAAEVS